MQKRKLNGLISRNLNATFSLICPLTNRRMFKRILSFVLAAALTAGMLPPVRVSAAEVETAAPVVETTEAPVPETTETAPATTVPAEETVAPTEAVTEPAMETEAVEIVEETLTAS